MFHRILVPLDGSQTAELATPVAVWFARALGARLVLLQAVPPEWWLAGEAAPMSVALGPDIIDAIMAGARSYLDQVADRLRQADCPVDTDIVVGPAAPAILDCAAADPDTLVVMATHGRTGLARAVLGSVAMAVVRAGTSPVVLVRPGARQPDRVHRVLVPLDGSPAAEAVLPVVERLAQAISAVVVLGRVRLPDELPNDVDQYLAAFAERLRLGGLAVETRSLEGRPADAIVAAAGLAQADLIAMTTRGRTSLATLVFGSTAERVLGAAPVPVLLVRG